MIFMSRRTSLSPEFDVLGKLLSSVMGVSTLTTISTTGIPITICLLQLIKLRLRKNSTLCFHANDQNN